MSFYATQQTPSERKGINVGDEVLVNDARSRGLYGRIFLDRDDGTTIPKFRDEHGNRHFVTLMDVTKVEAGPVPGVKWSDAPKGATHYSMRSDHIQKWHKLDENGQWSYAYCGEWNQYGGAHPETQKAIPGVEVEQAKPCPSIRLKKELDACIAEVGARESAVQTAQRALIRAQAERVAKLEQIAVAGFRVDGVKVVKVADGPDTWEDGDIVRCIKREGRGAADIIVGGRYKVSVGRGGQVRVIDGEGDPMQACVQNGCFELVSKAPKAVSSLPLDKHTVRTLKSGDIVESLVNGIDICKGQRYTVTGVDHDGYILHKDNVGSARMRPHNQYKLVRRA